MIILQGISVEELLQKIELIVEKKIEEKIKIEKPAHLMSRKEVAAFFKVSIVTVHNWTKEGILPSHRVGSRIFYKSNEIEEVVTRIKKYKRSSYFFN
jgi:hypothetical protein